MGMPRSRVVVTGIGAITPLGKNVVETWEGLRSGVSGADYITRFDASRFKTRFACEVKNYNPTDYFPRREVRRMDLYCQFALISAQEAFEDSGLDLDAIDASRAGVIYASGIGGITTFYEEVRKYVEGGYEPRFSPFFVPKMISDIAAGMISMKYGFQGVNFATVSACASSNSAIIEAVQYLRNGTCDIIIAGGSEAAICPPGIGGFNSMKALSTRNDDPKRASRPFDKNRDGFVMGEGAGALVLETLEHALARGARIYAEIAGVGASADAYHLTAPHPEGLGAALVMKSALDDAGIAPEAIDYINVHGTSTPLGDVAELKAIAQVFGDHAYKMNISSTKSMTGHLLGAAGAVEAIASIMAIREGIVPPTINHEEPDPEIDPRFNLTLNRPQQRTIRFALSNTFGFGGHNASVIIKQYSPA